MNGTCRDVRGYWWATEFDGYDDVRYAGPTIFADCREMAEAILSCVRGPNGQILNLVPSDLLAHHRTSDGISIEVFPDAPEEL